MRADILVGIVGAPHGVKGEVRVKSFTERPVAIGRYGPLRSEDGRIKVTIRHVRPVKDDMVVARLDGVDTREAAAALTGTRLFLDRAALPAAEEEEFYHADLVGCAAVAEDGAPVGEVVAVVNYGGGDLLEIARPGRDSELIAFTRAFVPEVDLAGRRVTVASGALAGPETESPRGTGPEETA